MFELCLPLSHSSTYLFLCLLLLTLPNIFSLPEAASAATEGIILASYLFDEYKSKREERRVKKVEFLVEEASSEIEKKIREA